MVAYTVDEGVYTVDDGVVYAVDDGDVYAVDDGDVYTEEDVTALEVELAILVSDTRLPLIE